MDAPSLDYFLIIPIQFEEADCLTKMSLCENVLVYPTHSSDRAVTASNLRAEQKLDIKTTTKYAHAMVEDIRSAMQAMNMARAGTKKVKKAE